MLMFILVDGKETIAIFNVICFSGYRSGKLDIVIVYSKETGWGGGRRQNSLNQSQASQTM